MKMSKECLPELPEPWIHFLFGHQKPEWFLELMNKLEEAYKTSQVYPDSSNLFRAFEFFSPNETKVVILGQDPYHQKGQAHGLSFSVKEGTKIPPSLRNIFTERMNDLGKLPSNHGNLEAWAKQGVLLLNTSLSVEEGRPGSHKNLGWTQFTDLVIMKLGEEDQRKKAFILWGKPAQEKSKIIHPSHFILQSPHPSPLSAYRGFFGSKPFSSVNKFLHDHHFTTVNW